jgi:hypothetical protein
MTKILDKIEHSFWIKAIAGAVFLVMLYGNNALEIQKVKAESDKQMLQVKADALKSVDEDFVRKEMFQIIIEDLKDIKQILRTKK